MNRGLSLPTETIAALDELAAIATALIALAAIWRIGHQEWRKPWDMHARRIVLGFLSAVAMGHVLSPSWLPELAEQYALLAFLVTILIGGRPIGWRDRAPRLGPEARRE